MHLVLTHYIDTDSATVADRLPFAVDAALGPMSVGLFVAGFDMGPNVYVVQVPSGAVTAVLPTNTSQGPGSFQALGLSSRGLLCVADLLTNEIAFLDAWSEQWLGTLDASLLPGLNSQLNELTFSPDGSRLIVTATASDTLVLLDVQ